MDKHTPILALSHHPWGEDAWMNRQHLLSRLARRGWPVAYSTGALDLWQRRTSDWQSSRLLPRSHTRDRVLILEPGKLTPRYQRFSSYDRWVLRRHMRRMLSRLRAHSPHSAIIACFHPMFWPYIDVFSGSRVWFHAFDDYRGTAGWAPHDEIMLRLLTERADLITCSSTIIHESICGDSPKCFTLENGADVRAFTARAFPPPVPDDLADIPQPRVLYTGALNRKVDFKTIADVASSRPGLHWVLLGEMYDAAVLGDPTLAPHYTRCRSLPNVHFMGPRPHGSVCRYVHHCDVLAMCYRVAGDGWWRSGFPLKLHEYLASGKPVVSSPLLVLRPFSHLFLLCEGRDAWTSAIERCLRGEFSSPSQIAERLAVAQANSWDAKVDDLERRLLGLL